MKLHRLIGTALLAGALLLGAQTKGGEAPRQKPALPEKSAQCQGKTKDGTQCKRAAAAGSKFCWQHDPSKKSGKKKG